MKADLALIFIHRSYSDKGKSIVLPLTTIPAEWTSTSNPEICKEIVTESLSTYSTFQQKVGIRFIIRHRKLLTCNIINIILYFYKIKLTIRTNSSRHLWTLD